MHIPSMMRYCSDERGLLIASGLAILDNRRTKYTNTPDIVLPYSLDLCKAIGFVYVLASSMASFR